MVDTIKVVNQEVVYKEKLRTVPDSASIKALFECSEKGEVLLKQILELKSGNTIKPSIKVDNGLITFDCNVDSLAIYHEFYGRYNKSDSTSIKSQTDTKVVEKKSTLNTFLLNYSIITTLILLGIVLYKYLKGKLYGKVS